MRATSSLCARVRFTTKDVGRGFYRGTRTGSMGAHTEYGNYIIDWRKVRHYNVPDLVDFRLTPFVSREVSPKDSHMYDEALQTSKIAGRTDAMAFLHLWKRENPAEYDSVKEHNKAQFEDDVALHAESEAETDAVVESTPLNTIATEPEQKQKA